MNKFVSLLLFASVTQVCRADDQTRQVQSALSDAGFYFGTADGKMGDETRAALRRFQIRNGLDVSGEMSPETLAALKIETPGKEPGVAPAKPSVAAEDEEQIASTARKPDAFLAPQKRENPQPPKEISDIDDTAVQPRGYSPTSDLFAETDLAEADAEEQAAALQDAQKQLRALGYYRSAPNGLADTETETALLRFQHAIHLRLTGRLDADTRQALVDAPPSVPSKSFRRSQNRPPGTVLRGVWVR